MLKVPSSQLAAPPLQPPKSENTPGMWRVYMKGFRRARNFQQRVRPGAPSRGDPLKTAGKHTGAVTQCRAAAFLHRRYDQGWSHEEGSEMGATEEVDGFKSKEARVVQEILKESVGEEITEM